MPVVETISIINKSGKLVSTTKHLVNIFKDARDAYQEKKAEIRAEILQKNEERAARKMLKNIRIEEVQSEASSRHSRRHSSRNKTVEAPVRPLALTEHNLNAISEASDSSSHRGSHNGSERSHRSPHSPRSPAVYRAYSENADISHPNLTRRHTDSLPLHDGTRDAIYAPPRRAMTSPVLDDDTDVHLAYGDLPPDLHPQPSQADGKEAELNSLMSKIDNLMVEAQCIQHSAATIIASLQANPEAMAAVALTLAEISNLLSKMGPSVLAALKGGSPAIFALLASPQFLIAGGVAVGVTIVMFGGYKIVKKIQQNAEEVKEANRMNEALVYEGELGSIESWRRGIADEEARSVATSVDGEFITPEAARVTKERIRDRAKEQRAKSVASSARTLKQKSVAARSSSRTVVSESVRSESTVRPRTYVSESVRSESTVRPRTYVSESRRGSTVKPKKDAKEKAKKSSALSVLLKKSIRSSDKANAKSTATGGHSKPRLLEI